jgi:prepilin-type N-terminal cleavage/methylation domain-containing protein
MNQGHPQQRTLQRRAQAGFTLVEIAIVLVIVGLLLGAVLKGQELIFNSKVKATFNMSREFSAAINSYQDRYQALPGDDAAATTRFPAAVPATANGNGNGIIAWQTNPCPTGTGGGGENCQVFYHLRLGGFISGGMSDSPRHPFGGAVGLATNGTFIPNGGNSAALALTNGTMTNKAMSALDTSFDDGLPTSGAIRCNQATYNLSLPDGAVNAWCTMAL